MPTNPAEPQVDVSEPNGLNTSNDKPQSLHDLSSHSDHLLGELVEGHPPTQIQTQ